MKRLFFSSVFICAFFFKGNGQSMATVDSVPKMKYDTTILNRYDTLPLPGGYDLGYEQDSSMVAFFRPYFVTDICKPGDIHHTVYLNFIKKADQMEKRVIAQFKKLLERDTTLLWRRTTGRIRNLDSCTYKVLPVYYLSPNVVLYRQGDNLTDFFTLDTTTLVYRIIKNNKVVGIIENQDNIRLGPREYDSSRQGSNYEHVLSLHKEPIGIELRLRIPELDIQGPSLGAIGYSQDGHLIRVEYSKNDYDKVTGHLNPKTGKGETIVVGKDHQEKSYVRLVDNEYKTQLETHLIGRLNLGERIDLSYNHYFVK